MHRQTFRDVHQRVIHIELEGDHLTEALGEESPKNHQCSPRYVGLHHLCAPNVEERPEWGLRGRHMDLQ